MILLIISVVMSYVSFQQLFSINDLTLYEYSFVACNIACSLCLMLVALCKLYVERALANPISVEDEDATLNKLERRLYVATFFIICAIVLSFITVVISFIVVRNTHPEIAWIAIVLMIISLFSFATGPKTTDMIYPNANLMFTKQVKTVTETLDFYDDGQKHLFLKTLYRLYFAVILGLIVLIFFLMFYSIISGVSQIISIIGIGIILFMMLIVFTMSLMPSKVSSSSR